ncbi:hypothetical protein GSI_00701 [Ganoderma sinense ZZ0214-1]|uniref:RNA polymerase II assembly factor Rtp1 C-terminal domain-containing protein n=1 Tax=Ganoderma sinense ZZ0214-1 TaxID=1077348 RepID=A0A2G8STA4_9APHY|nr:hypothetical protein GSI_00701 [Ganoderma sinense ZZ0214-1]
MLRGKSLEELYQAATILTRPPSSSQPRPNDLKRVLSRRLVDYHAFCGHHTSSSDSSLESIQLDTAIEALVILEPLHERLKHPDQPVQTPPRGSGSLEENSPEKNPMLIGSRDMALIRTLISIVFKWAIEPLLQRAVAAIPSTAVSSATRGAKIIDLTGLPQQYSLLVSLTSRLLALPLSAGLTSPLSKSVVTATLLNQHLSDLLLPCIVIGWLPKSLSSDSMPSGDVVRPQVMYLLSRLPPSQVISAVGQALSNTPISLPYARRASTFILGRQLIRPEGLHGLCESVFAEEDVSGDDAPLEKLEHVARVLNTIPAGMAAEASLVEYSKIIIPRILLLLSLDGRALPGTHRRAIAFSLSRILTNDDNPVLQKASSDNVLSMIHDPILHGKQLTMDKGTGEISADASLRTIQVLLTNTDPSPRLISTLFTPIVPSLYALYAYLEGNKTSDPLLRESLKGYLETWGRLVGSTEVISTLWRIVDGEGGNWRVDVAGTISKIEDATQDAASLSLFTPESLKQAEEAGEFDVDANILGLKPDPIRFVAFLRAMNRADVSSELFVKLLEGYQELGSRADADPLRTLLYLQLVLQMQQQLSSEDSLGILKKPEHILSFIKQVLDTRQAESSQTGSGQVGGLRMEDLRIVAEESEDELDDGDSDDEEGAEGVTGRSGHDMKSAAVKLLLSVLEALEANPDLSARNAPVLNDIFTLLEPLSKAPDEEIRSLAREARMVMTARLASTSAHSGGRPSKASSEDAETPQETYQKALKLLQDPLLPVRAHGLLLLRQLVSARKPTPASASVSLAEPELDRALVPGILSIFMQSIQDDDSYMFLNAVQGLSAMVDGYGKDVLRGLVSTYAGGLDSSLGASALSQHDVDVRTRVGEALGQVVRRCGEALPSYAPLLLPPLFQVVRTPDIPTVLRTSAISLLAQCAKTNALAVLPYIVDLADAMIDLLQIESVAGAHRKSSPRSKETSEEKATVGLGEEEDLEEKPAPPTMDSQPTSTNTKFPPLRRAALHFLSLLIQACIYRVYETGDAEGLMLPPGLMKRARTTLGYVAATDADDVIRVMAREAVEGLDQLAEAVLGV